MNDARRAPDTVTQEVADYYRDTTVESYLTWGGESLALHLGLSDDDAPITERPALDRALLRMNAWLADRAGVGEGARVLDAGCGVGGSTIWLTRERGAAVTGVTLDPGQAAMARAYAAARGADGARFEVVDFAQTDFPEASFDVVWNMESLCHARDPRAYLAHVRDLLRPGGRFACVDVFRVDREAHDEVDAMCEGWVLPALMTLDEASRALRELGFAAVETADLTARVLPSAAVMGSVSFEEILRHELSVMQGAAPKPALVRHYRASLAAASALGLGSVRYAYLGAARPA